MGIGHHLKLTYGPLQQCGQAGKRRHSEPTRSGVFIVLKPLKPDSHAELMNSSVDLQIVRIGVQISAVPDTGSIVGPGRSDAGCTGRGRAPVDDDPSRPLSGHKRKV